MTITRSTGPRIRPRRLRASATIRDMVRETQLAPDDFIYPLFLVHGRDVREEVPSMPGVYNLSIDELVSEVKEVAGLNIPAVMLFGVPATKDELGSENFAADGIVQQGIRAIKASSPETVVITDVCMCEYTDHGHCGVVHDGQILNDETLEILGKVVTSHADAGADIVAPSGMMDGMVSVIRAALDGDGYSNVSIMSYAVKYASGFYGPFRDAAHSAPAFGDRRSHQMDPANVREALREAALDVQEGADFLMVKPALPYLDVVYRVKQAHPELPLAAYSVSGEYAMLKAAAANGWLDERIVAMEALTGIKRAGADLILTYFAKDAVRWLAE